MAKRPAAPEYRTNTTVVRMEDIRYPRWERIQVNYPLVPDRAAPGNINYQDKANHRGSRGKTPAPGLDFNNLTTSPVRDFDSAEYKFISPAPNASNVPEGFYGTSSGIYPVDFIPFAEGDSTDNPATITGDLIQPASGEFFISRNINTNNMDGNLEYNPVNSGCTTGRMQWEILPEFNNPTEPEVRYPLGARKKNFFK